MKETNSFNDQTSNFCEYAFISSNKNNNNKNQQKIFDLFKLTNKDTMAIPVT